MLVVTDLFTITVNDFDAQKNLLVVAEFVVSGTQCIHTRELRQGLRTDMQAHFATIHDSQHKRKASPTFIS